MEQTNAKNAWKIETAEIVLPCADLGRTLEFFTDRLGFTIRAVFPADDPALAVISGYGVRLRLERAAGADPLDNKHIRLRLSSPFPERVAGGQLELTAPNGIRIELVAAYQPVVVPELKPSFVLTKYAADQTLWVEGRAGMRYRDLIPDRQGGRFIASHIQIQTGGPVPDYVHFHKVRFQMIYCYKGWARLVYEDQGKPFLFYAGDCILQPPEIRHRVLESSAGLEVIEISCPAEHETLADHELALPTDSSNPKRDFKGQRFVRHIPSETSLQKWRLPGFECLDTGIGAATNGLAGARTVYPTAPPQADAELIRHDGEFVFFFILEGSARLHREDNRTDPLAPGDALVIPADLAYYFSNCSADLEMLEVTLPAKLEN